MRFFLRRLGRSLLPGALLALAALVLLALWPSSRPPFSAQSHPAPDFTTARARAARDFAAPPPEVRPECRGRVLDHGRRTRDVYVLLHGLTNCPAQFRDFAALLFSGGSNVLLPRLPGHGLRDRLTDEPARLTAQEMLDSANLAVDLARGYGERVIVIGLSINAVTAAWLAQERGDIDLAVVIAPLFAPAGFPGPGVKPLANLLHRLPNAFLWWDATQKEALVGSPFSYPRFPTRAIAETMALGFDVFARAGKTAPRARKILLVTSPADDAISRPRVEELDALWRGRADVRTFPADWKIPHDCIDPDQPGGRIDLVYPQLREWIDAEMK